MKKKLTYYLIAIVAITAINVACSTEKAKWGNIQYHNTTCHYNVWWNGNESLKAGREKLYKSAVDDYTQFLPAEALGNIENARSVFPEMDRAIEKGVKGIKKHSIFVKGEEHVPYIKECYLLTAYATFYKQDYVATTNTCNILLQQFSGTRACDEGAILMARCLVKDERYSEAEAVLDQLVMKLNKGNFSRSQRDKLFVAMIEATVPQQKYKKTVEYIHLAIESSSSNRTKARLTFLMAQIYQQLDKRSVAAKYYHEVLGYAPEYVMEFNARLGEASCADLEHSDIQKLERQLDRMLDDKKNREYADQIYYAKGEMFMGVKDAQKACDNFKFSVAKAKTNKAQKAKSALRLASILYDLYENYDMAQIYYDTAMQCITKSYPGYNTIKRRYDILTELVDFTRVYERNDSLLTVAAMSEIDRLKLINDKIDTLKKREDEARMRALIDEMSADAVQQQNTLNSDWYFYNPQTVQKGKETFRQKWGLRALEDLWCLANKNMFSMSMPEELVEEDSDTAQTSSDVTKHVSTTKSQGNPDDPHSVAYYLKDLPTTQHQLDSIDSLTSVSLLGAGYIYYDGIANLTRALECYLRMTKDYTSYDEIVHAFYMLYRIYDQQGNTPQANYYRDMVLMGFPDSDFANLIRDNEYYKELQARERKIEDDYEKVYDFYSRKRYMSVVRAVEEAENTYAGNPQLYRFRYFKGLALARHGERQQAILSFEKLIADAKDDTIVSMAEVQLDLLKKDSLLLFSDKHSETITVQDEQRLRDKQDSINMAQPIVIPKKDELPSESRVFRYRRNQQHFVLVVVNDRTVKATELQSQLADFNSKYYSNNGLRVNALYFTDTTQLLTIYNFADEEKAMSYYSHLKQQESPLSSLSGLDYTLFSITKQNYETFYNRRNIDAYMAFFRRYYLKNNE